MCWYPPAVLCAVYTMISNTMCSLTTPLSQAVVVWRKLSRRCWPDSALMMILRPTATSFLRLYLWTVELGTASEAVHRHCFSREIICWENIISSHQWQVTTARHCKILLLEQFPAVVNQLQWVSIVGGGSRIILDFTRSCRLGASLGTWRKLDFSRVLWTSTFNQRKYSTQR